MGCNGRGIQFTGKLLACYSLKKRGDYRAKETKVEENNDKQESLL